MTKVFILSGCRTAIGNFQGQLEKFSASELGTIVISEAIDRANLEPKDVDQVIMGQVLTAGQGQNPARQAAINANIPHSSPAFTVNMMCGSGLKTVALGFQALKNNDCSIVVAGGQESMTRAEHTAYIRGNKMGSINLNDTLLVDGLTDAFHKIHMGNTDSCPHTNYGWIITDCYPLNKIPIFLAEHLAKTYNISREAQDEFAALSQNKSEQAIKNGYFEKEIVAVEDKRTKNIINKDEFPRFGTTTNSLAKLRPCFDKNGTVTPGNSSGINDGAAAVVLANENIVTSKNLKPLAEIIACAEVGVDPICMGMGPIAAVQKVLQKAGWSKDDVDLYELNEAFAVQSIVVLKELGVDPAKVNVCGGAIALGHPIGCSGARVLVTLLFNLLRLGLKKGIASLCIGGGMGIAIAIEIC